MKASFLSLSLGAAALLSFSSCTTTAPVYGDVEQVQKQSVPSLPYSNEDTFVRGAVEFNNSVTGQNQYYPRRRFYPRGGF